MKAHLLLAVAFGLLVSTARAQPAALQAAPDKASFLQLCDRACVQLTEDNLYKSQLKRQHYKDSYSIRALAVAFDLTGNAKYLQVCQQWSDKMVQCQDGMTPKGAYYMNYGRKPGEQKGSWYAADSASIGMGVLATAIRTSDPAARARYLQSVRQFADLVIDNYVREGGITDGLWEKYDGPWWCSTGIFGSLAFLLHETTGEAKYLNVALGTIDWLNRQDFGSCTPATYDIAHQGPAYIMYFFEAYSAGLPHLDRGSARETAALKQMQNGLAWIRQHHHAALSPELVAEYNSQWGSKISGLPFHEYVWSRQRPSVFNLRAEADEELTFVGSMINEKERLKKDANDLSQLMNFAMMSLAEKLSPGALYRH